MNTLLNINKIAVVILAAGRGTRLGCTDKPKVMLELSGRPIVSYIVETLEKLNFSPKQIVLVVGFKQEKVREYFGDRVVYAFQEQQKGTAHATYVGMQTLPKEIEDVLVLNGDDSAFYKEQTLVDFISKHFEQKNILSLLSADVNNNTGKIVRMPNGDIEIVEKEYLTEDQKLIKETSTGTFMINRVWYEKIFPNMLPLSKLGEYGLNVALSMARDQKEKYQVIKLKNSEEWFGINTFEELEKANLRKNNLLNNLE